MIINSRKTDVWLWTKKCYWKKANTMMIMIHRRTSSGFCQFSDLRWNHGQLNRQIWKTKRCTHIRSTPYGLADCWPSLYSSLISTCESIKITTMCVRGMRERSRRPKWRLSRRTAGRRIPRRIRWLRTAQWSPGRSSPPSVDPRSPTEMTLKRINQVELRMVRNRVSMTNKL